MEYAQSYALYNYKLNDPTKPISYDNLSLIRYFTNHPSEHGFILVHIAMVKFSGDQVKHTMSILEAAEKKDRVALNSGMDKLLGTFKSIQIEMETMWKFSKPEDYLSFRTFIMGTKSQPMFPNGVLYSGVSETPTFYRGESGANDSIIPSADNLLQLTQSMPNNPLTDILKVNLGPLFVPNLLLASLFHLNDSPSLSHFPLLFCQKSHLGLQGWKPSLGWRPLSEELVKEGLEFLLNADHLPILILCT